MSEYLSKIGDFPPTGAFDPKFQVEGVAPTNHSQKTRLNVFSYGMKNLDRSFFRFVTMDTFDRRMDGRTDGRLFIASPRCHSMQRGKNTEQ